MTGGAVADGSQALPLIEGMEAEGLLADKAYDTNEIISAVRELGVEPVIPPKSNRREKRDYDRALYKLPHLVKNGFLEFKQWRGIAPRYAKRAASYPAACQLRAAMSWTRACSRYFRASAIRAKWIKPRKRTSSLSYRVKNRR